MAHEHPFAFEPGAIDYAENATRFLHGTPGRARALRRARRLRESWRAIGVDAIRRKSRAPGAAPRWTAPARAGSRRDPDDPDRAVEAWPSWRFRTARRSRASCCAAKIIVDHRPGAGIRYLPHFYTTDDEILHAHRPDAGDPRFGRLSSTRSRRENRLLMLTLAVVTATPRGWPTAAIDVHRQVAEIGLLSGTCCLRTVDGSRLRRSSQSMAYRRTLKRGVGCTGIGPHTGRAVRLDLKPAPADHGIRFRRTDVGVEIPRPYRPPGAPRPRDHPQPRWRLRSTPSSTCSPPSMPWASTTCWSRWTVPRCPCWTAAPRPS